MSARRQALISSTALLSCLAVYAEMIFLSDGAYAACTTSGQSTICTPSSPNPITVRIGEGNSPAGDDRSVNVQTGSQIVVGNDNAISLRDRAAVRVQNGAGVSATATTLGGQYGTGRNTIEFRNNGTLTVEQGGEVRALGTQIQGEAVNLQGSANVVTNNGTIRALNAAAIWFQNASGLNTIINNATGTIQAPGNVIGASGNGAVDFSNYGQVIGNLVFAGGNDTLRLFTGSSITGNFAGSAGNDTVYLSGAGTSTLPGNFTNFETLYKNDPGTWTLSGTITGVTVANVQQGTLVLTGNNTNYTGRVIVDPSGTLEARAQSLPPTVTNNGLVRFAQPDAGTYVGLLSGVGAVEKTGAGTLTLAPAAPGGNTYSGGTRINQGTVAIGADSALGASSGSLTFNGGTLQFNNSFNLASSRAVALNTLGGTINTQDFTSAVSQPITGAGALTKAGSGSLILTGTNSYAGGTTISAGTLQLGTGGASGSIVGNVANQGTLVFNRSDTSAFSGRISGSGSLQQVGTGTTILTANHTYTGGTSINAGTLQLGNGGLSGSIIGNVVDNGTLAFDRSNLLTFDGEVSGSGRLQQDGTGTTVLTANNTYSGGTLVRAGTLSIGDPDHLSAALSGGGGIEVASGATLGGYGRVTGSVMNAGRIAVADAISAFTGQRGGNFTIDGSLANSGIVQVGGAGVGNTLTVTQNYVGQNGVIALNTHLGGAGSASDRLVIDGGLATGTSGLQITNVGGGGALTTGNGILVVDAINGGRTARNAFTLSRPVSAGAYEYSLFRGSRGATAPESWYLRSEAPAQPPVTPSPPPAPVVPFRPEVPLLSALPNLARQIGLVTLGTWHERVGGNDVGRMGLSQSPSWSALTGGPQGASAGAATDAWAPGAWGRTFAEKSWTTQQGLVRPETDAAIGGFQIGMDLWQRDWSDGARTKAGVFGAYTYGEGDVSGFASGLFNRAVGRLTTDAATLGGYVTHIGTSGWYVDGVVQHTWLDSQARALGALSNPDADGRLWTASLEAGVPFKLDEHWALEPQAQIIYQRLGWNDAPISNALVRFDSDAATWIGRIGARLQGLWQTDGGTIVRPYLLANLWHRSSGTDLTSFVTAAAATVIPTQFGGTSLEVGGGAKVQLNQNTELFGQASYAAPISSSHDDRRALRGNVGLTVRW